MPASPCSLAHRGCSVSDKYDTMMPDTVSPTADSSVQTPLLSAVEVWVCIWIWRILLLWKNTEERCCMWWCWMRQSKLSSLKRYAFDHTHTHPFIQSYGLFVFFIFILKTQRWLDVITNRTQSETSGCAASLTCRFCLSCCRSKYVSLSCLLP